jgi:hypothetical protein
MRDADDDGSAAAHGSRGRASQMHKLASLNKRLRQAKAKPISLIFTRSSGKVEFSSGSCTKPMFRLSLFVRQQNREPFRSKKRARFPSDWVLGS